jgi:hypothetical protein
LRGTYKESLSLVVRGKQFKSQHSESVGKERDLGLSKGLECADKFLENAWVEPSQEAYLNSLQGTMDHLIKLAQLMEGFEVELREAEQRGKNT